MSRLESKGGPSTSTSRQSPSTGSYVPPHLRRAANPSSSPAGPSSSSRYGPREPDSTFGRPRSFQPNSRSDPSPRDDARRSYHLTRRLDPDSSPSHRATPGSWTSPSSDRFRSAPASSSSRSWSKYPTTSHLFISGDSFVGALSPALGPKEEEVDLRDTEQLEEMRVARRIRRVIIDKGKGAAAKGLNNPNSKKGQAPKLLSFIHDAFPDRHDYFRDPRFFMLMYGNVDLNINYLWQLRNRPLQTSSFTSDELKDLTAPFEAFTNYVPPETGDDDVRAKHTDNDIKGHALGPKQFVAKVVREYTTFIEREIVNGPIGLKLKGLAEETRSVHWRGGGESVSKVLVAGTLPPMVLDRHLYRLQAKYVDQHADTPTKALGRTDDLSLSSLTLDASPTRVHTDQPLSASTRSSASSQNRDRRSLFEDDMIDSTHSSFTSPSELSEEDKLEILAKKTFDSMLAQQPPICTLPTRVEMIDQFNSSLKTFCSRHPDVLKYVSINEAMRSAHPDPLIPTGSDSEENVVGTAILQYYCSQAPGDGANIHPTWERTYPLWLDCLREAGVDVDSFPNVDLDKTEAQWTASKEERLLKSKYRT